MGVVEFLESWYRGTLLGAEQVRQKISDDIHERLKTDVKTLTKKCESCGKILPWDFTFAICDVCHAKRSGMKNIIYTYTIINSKSKIAPCYLALFLTV